MTTVSPAAASRADTARELVERIHARTLRCGVVGLGHVGSVLAEAVASAGFDVTGHDRLHSAKTSLAERLPGVAVSTTPELLGAADAIVVATRPEAPAGAAEALRPIADLVNELAPRPRLILVASTVPPGATRALHAATGRQHFVAHGPERLRAEDDVATFGRIPHLVGGVDEESLLVGAAFLATLCRDVVTVSVPEVSELSKLLENAFRATGIALVGEMTRLAHALGISAAEVGRAAATKPFGYHAFHAGPGVGGHCLPNDLAMLEASALAAGVASPFLAAAQDALERMPVSIVDHLLGAAARGSSPAGRRVLIVGTGFKPGSSEQANPPAAPIVRELRRRDVAPSFFDSKNDRLVVDGLSVPRAARAEVDASRFDAALILADDEALPKGELARSIPIVVDACVRASAVDGDEASIPL
jgi:UDP-N-acetyl-D-glucosamine dehydrogenase